MYYTFNENDYIPKGLKVQENLLDIIKTENKTYVGVIDYVSTKHVTIFDMTNNYDSELSMAVIIYKMYFSYMRFSVYKAKYFAHYDINEPLMVNKKNIKDSSHDLVTHKPNKKTFKYSNK